VQRNLIGWLDVISLGVADMWRCARQRTRSHSGLLTDGDGVASAQAAPVWAGMQAASLTTSGKVSFLVVSGPDTEANAVVFVNTLIQRKCNLVLAVGASESMAAQAQSKVFPAVRFVVVGSASASGNVQVVPSGSATSVRDAVAVAVEGAADR
jgi:hypothetical protein